MPSSLSLFVNTVGGDAFFSMQQQMLLVREKSHCPWPSPVVRLQEARRGDASEVAKGVKMMSFHNISSSVGDGGGIYTNKPLLRGVKFHRIEAHCYIPRAWHLPLFRKSRGGRSASSGNAPP